MPYPVEALLFDLDGTLIDSRQDIVNAANHALGRLALPHLAADVISGHVGDGVNNLMTGCLSYFSQMKLQEDAVEQGSAYFKEFYSVHLLDHTRLYPGVAEVLEHFRDKKMAVITNKPAHFTQQILEGLGVRCYFAVILGGDSLPSRKPDPGPVLKVLGDWQSEAGKVVVVGDSGNDIEAGKRSRTRTCAVTYGFKSPAEVAKLGADWTIDRMIDLKRCVC